MPGPVMSRWHSVVPLDYDVSYPLDEEQLRVWSQTLNGCWPIPMQYYFPRSDELLFRQPASRLPEIAHGHLPLLVELHGVGEPRQFHRSDLNCTASRGDLCRRHTRCSLKFVDAIHRGVDRAQLLRQVASRGVSRWCFAHSRAPSLRCRGEMRPSPFSVAP